jgi:hypothetical protein
MIGYTARRRLVALPTTALLGISAWLGIGPTAWTAPASAVSIAETAAVTVAGGARTASLTCFAVDVSGSNLVASGSEPASDPGPTFVRQQVVELFGQVLADLGEANGQRMGVVTFGTILGSRIGPVPVSASGAENGKVLADALRPTVAEAAWTDWVAGVSGCAQMFARAGDPRGMLVMLTDGFPQGPAGGPAAQLATIAPMAEQLWAHGITIQPVLYGGGAGRPGPARQAMTRLAALGHGQLVLAATPLDMLRAALSLASLSTGLPLGGAEVAVDGSTTVPLDVSPQVAVAVLVALRSSDQLQISIDAPVGRTLASMTSGTPGLGLVVALTRPVAGSYQASADGQGSMYVAELLRYATVTAVSPGRSPSPLRPHPNRTGIGSGSGSGVSWLSAVILVAAALSLVLVSSRFMATRRRSRGTLVVWWGSRYCLLDPADVVGRTRLEELFHDGGDSTGWSVSWTRRAPVAFRPEGLAVRLMPEQTWTAPATPPATFTWFPDGLDVSLAEEPPGRPASAPAP